MLHIKHNPSSAHRPISSTSSSYVPLKQVKVEADIRSFAADVTIEQIFRNDETTPIEAVYCFPIEEQAAIYSFIARIDDREIVAELKEKKEAQKDYSEALQQGHGAYLLEQDEKSQDNFIINVGALPAGKECLIRISYVTELPLVDNGKKIRFAVPTTIAPRYNPDQGGTSSPAGTTSQYIQTSPYTIELLCRIDKFGVRSVSSLSHPIQIDLAQQNQYVITFAQRNTHLDRDILIDLDLIENHSNTILAVEPGAAMVALTPKEEDCRRAMNATDLTNEFIFVVDCSGSMEDENKIGLARQAMVVFLKSLPVGSYFNIIRFGSSHVALFNTVTAIYNEENARKAERLTSRLKADLGGTELLKPLQWLEKHPAEQGRARQIFLLTDGEISNVTEVLDLCRSMATSARIFSFGLGHSPSRSLVKGLARATNGRFVFIPPKSDVDTYVGEQLQKALQSCITNVKIRWNVSHSILQAPTKVPPVYADDRLIFYALANDSTMIFNPDTSVELYAAASRIGEAKMAQIPHVSRNGTIARLAAKALILELEHDKSSSQQNTGSLQGRFQRLSKLTSTTEVDGKEAAKKRIIELSLKYNILSPHTAFIGIERRIDGSNASMVLREVPIQISADDQHLLASPPAAMCYSTMSNCSVSANRMVNQYVYDDDDINESSLFWCDYDSMKQRESSNLCMYLATTPSAVTNDDDEEEEDEDEEMCFSRPSKKYKESWPTTDADIVRHLISKQNFDGLWNFADIDIEELTGKGLSTFPQTYDQAIMISAIVIVCLETRFASFSSLWYGVVQKARKRLTDLIGQDEQKLKKLLEDIRQQL